MEPSMKGKKKHIKKRMIKGIMPVVLAAALLFGSLQLVPVQKVQAAGENLIQNPNFAENDLSAWMDTGAKITVESQEEEIFDGVKTYATISERTQTYQGFSQDVTALVEPGEEYEISFYVKLSEDYKGLGTAERQVFFGPYVVEDGETKYLSQAYSGEISGGLLKECPVGEWVQLSGSYLVAEDATQVVVRFQEESSKNMGSYSVTGVSMKKKGEEKPVVQAPGEDALPRLRDSITVALGEETIVGMVTHPVNNKKEWEVLVTHANAVTTGNELKPDSHFGYSNAKCPGTETVTLNGKQLLVPKIDFSRGNQFLNGVLKHNEANPDNQIKVRGHVLVWHAQTPEWFFHEEYDPSKDYVSKEVMDQRLEWYIKSILQHYLGPDSKYKDLFYGWDVVNEACADSTAMVYRDDTGGDDKLTDSTHGTKSSWWHIYQSNEYIINAFKYANKYAPADVELYYNDYNEIWNVKVPNICELLRAVKAEEGAPGVGTRIDGFGMQAHYSLDDFNVQNFESAAKSYLDIVGKIQLTELDMKASSRYDGTAATRDQEYQDQALCYQSIFEALQRLEAVDGYDVTGITFWGVTDPTSWLQNRSDVGGGADGLRSQCPLLFDGNYEAKPAFWAFVDPSKIKIAQKRVEVRRVYDGKFKDGNSYAFEYGNTSATMIPIWDEDGLKVQVEVKDKSLDGEKDYVTVYFVEETEGREEITPTIVKVTREEASAIGGGYRAVVKVPLKEYYFGKQFLLDVKVTNGDGTEVSFNDIQGTQETSSLNYAFWSLKPALTYVPKGSPKVDGVKDEIWDTAATLWLNVNTGAAESAAKVKLLWDTEKLYVLAQIQDGDVSAAGTEPYEQDSLEIYIDENHARSATYGNDDKRYRINCENEVTCLGKKASEKKVESVTQKTDDGFVIEASFAWTDLSPKVHNLVGLELRLNDANASGVRIGTLSWNDETGEAGTSTACFGTIKLAVEGEPREETENPDAQFSRAKAFAAPGSGTGADDGAEKDGNVGDGTPISDEKEVKDNPKQNLVWVWLLAAAVVVAAAGAFLGVRAQKKKTRQTKGQDKEGK